MEDLLRRYRNQNVENPSFYFDMTWDKDTVKLTMPSFSVTFPNDGTLDLGTYRIPTRIKNEPGTPLYLKSYYAIDWIAGSPDIHTKKIVIDMEIQSIDEVMCSRAESIIMIELMDNRFRLKFAMPAVKHAMFLFSGSINLNLFPALIDHWADSECYVYTNTVNK